MIPTGSKRKKKRIKDKRNKRAFLDLSADVDDFPFVPIAA